MRLKQLMKRFFQAGFLVLLVLPFTYCASTADEDLEKARVALDNAQYDTAITAATAALNADTSNVDAALVLSSAYAGKGGVELTDLMINFLKVSDNKDNEFSVVHDALVASIATEDDLSNLRSAITTLTDTLTPTPTATNANFKNYSYQLGILQLIEAFGLGSIKSELKGESTTTVSRLVAADCNTSQADFIAADANLDGAGFGATDDIRSILRENYCVLDKQAGGDGDGFSLAVLRDQVICQLDGETACQANCTVVPTCATFLFSACSGAGAPAATTAGSCL